MNINSNRQRSVTWRNWSENGEGWFDAEGADGEELGSVAGNPGAWSWWTTAGTGGSEKHLDEAMAALVRAATNERRMRGKALRVRTSLRQCIRDVAPRSNRYLIPSGVVWNQFYLAAREVNPDGW